LRDYTGKYVRWLNAYNPTRSYFLDRMQLSTPLVRGTGHFLYDAEGHQYLDFLSQYGAVSFGHNHPDLWQALQSCAEEQLPAMVQPLVPVAAQRLAERLAEITPGALGITVFANSGAETVEAAIKLARARTGRLTILSTINGFHGKTLGALSATGRPAYQAPFGAPLPHFEYVPFGDAAALQETLERDGERIAAFIVEPVQGEGGVVPAPPGYLATALALCRRYGVLSIVDEVQTGLGRTGKLFGLPEEAGAPDILLLAKALSGGLVPIGACITTPETWDHQFGALHSSTFANSNLAARVALAAIDLLLRDGQKLVRHVAEGGHYLLRRLRVLQAAYPGVIREVRGVGYLVGVEFFPFEGDDSYTMAFFCQNDYLIALFASYLFSVHRVITAPVFNHSLTLRLEPPFTVGPAEIDRMIGALGALCDTIDRKDYYHLVRHLTGTARVGARGRVRFVAPHPPNPVPARSDDDGRRKSFAFVGHYTAPRDFVTGDPSFAQFTPEEFDRWRDYLQWAEPGVIYRLPGIRSRAGATADGCLIGVPMLPADMMRRGRRRVLPILEDAVALARDQGARIVGLGGFTSIVSKGGQSLVGRGIAVTSGNGLTTVMALRGIEDVIRRLGLALPVMHTAVVGATGAIGRLASVLLAEQVASLTLVGNPSSRDAIPRCRVIAGEIYVRLLDRFESGTTPPVVVPIERQLRRVLRPLLTTPSAELPVELASLAPDLREARRSRDGAGYDHLAISVERAFAAAGQEAPITWTTDLSATLPVADLVFVATNSDAALIEVDPLKPGAVVCDVARPRNVSPEVAELRDDVLLFEGGLVELPEPVHFGPNLGFRPGITLGCLGETILLALEGDDRDHSIGERLDPAGAEYLRALADKHGFLVAPPHCFGVELSEDHFTERRLAREAGRLRPAREGGGTSVRAFAGSLGAIGAFDGWLTSEPPPPAIVRPAIEAPAAEARIAAAPAPEAP
jgi:acetylornithine/succinyldiaminopimelate/putrescine aminotransferase/predicted amino acid dehydrogenase